MWEIATPIIRLDLYTRCDRTIRVICTVAWNVADVSNMSEKRPVPSVALTDCVMAKSVSLVGM